MKIRAIIVMGIIGALTFSGFLFSAHAQLPKFPPDKKVPDTPSGPGAGRIDAPPPEKKPYDRPIITPRIEFYQINNGAASTGNKNVLLNNRVIGAAQFYRACENPNFAGCDWQNYEPAPKFVLSERKGSKTVYFQVKNVSGEREYASLPAQDSIEYTPRHGIETSPGFVGQILSLNLTIARVYDPWKLDVNYEIVVSDGPGAESCSLNIQVDPIAVRGGSPTILSRNQGYRSGRAESGRIVHSGNFTAAIPLDQGTSISTGAGLVGVPLYQGLLFTVKIIHSGPFTPVTASKRISWTGRTIPNSHTVQACQDNMGHKGDWPFNAATANSWVGLSSLQLHNCGFVPDNGNEIKCDPNPLPALGERGARWEKRPATADQSGRVHWWCEAGTGQPLGLEVKTNAYEPLVN
jgi:hypothetical protein